MPVTRAAILVLFSTTALLAQVTHDQFAAIKKEGDEGSRVMAHLDHLVNRIGPRLTGSDNLTDAAEWAVDTFKSFGIENAHLEQWGEFAVGFNRGPWWGRMTKPDEMELVCNTEAWSAGTKQPSRGRRPWTLGRHWPGRTLRAADLKDPSRGRFEDRRRELPSMPLLGTVNSG
jgi:hypothetical protein